MQRIAVFVASAASFWDGYEPASVSLYLFATLPLRRNKTNGKWYCEDITLHSTTASICLGCALFKREMRTALPRCPLLLCATRQCILNAHPVIRDFKCHLSHHHDVQEKCPVINFEPTDAEVMMIESEEVGSTVHVAGEDLAGTLYHTFNY